jgi:integrase/recombinase XerD
MISRSSSEMRISDVASITIRQSVRAFLRWHQGLQVEKAARSLRARLIIRLVLFVGMRAHEIADARIEHVDPINGLIYVPHGHSSGPRWAAVDQTTLQLLMKYVGSRVRGPLLIRHDGSAITRHIVYYQVMRAAALSGIVSVKRVGPNVLKHTFATTWIRKDGNLILLKKQLGHRKLDSIQAYLDLLPEEVKAEHSRLFEGPRAVQRWRERCA